MTLTLIDWQQQNFNPGIGLPCNCWVASGEWKIFNGNEIGILLAYWVWSQYQAKHKPDPSQCAVLNSTVSSKMLRALAQKEGLIYEVLFFFLWSKLTIRKHWPASNGWETERICCEKMVKKCCLLLKKQLGSWWRISALTKMVSEERLCLLRWPIICIPRAWHAHNNSLSFIKSNTILFPR